MDLTVMEVIYLRERMNHHLRVAERMTTTTTATMVMIEISNFEIHHSIPAKIIDYLEILSIRIFELRSFENSFDSYEFDSNNKNYHHHHCLSLLHLFLHYD